MSTAFVPTYEANVGRSFLLQIIVLLNLVTKSLINTQSAKPCVVNTIHILSGQVFFYRLYN
jgi:hypothetical protein